MVLTPTNTDGEIQADDTTSLGFTYFADGELRDLTESSQTWLVDKIAKTYDRLEQGKSEYYTRCSQVQRAVRGVIKRVEADRFNALVPYGKQCVQTLLAHFWGRSLQSDKVLFSVRGRDEQSQENAPKQKQVLLEHLKRDKAQQKFDDSVHSALLEGGVFAHIGYEEKISPERVLSGLNGTAQSFDEDGSISFIEEDVTEKNGPKITLIEPENFVFDTTADDWDSAWKAYKCYKRYEDIADDPNYTNLEGLKELAKQENKKVSSKIKYRNRKKKKDERQYNDTGVDEQGRLELIEVHGDIRLEDGTLVRNWTITIAARKRVIRFERNQYYFNPFVKWFYEEADDGWPISPISYIVPLIDGASTLLNTGVEGAKLSLNPPYLAPKGFFPQKKVYVTEGKVIEYEVKQAMQQPYQPQPMQFKYDAPFPYLQLFESQTEATTGATRQLSGNVTTNDKVQTATEFQGLQVVGNMIIDRAIDLFNLEFKIPILEKCAKVLKQFAPEELELPVENGRGIDEFQTITPEVYSGRYEYYIEDSKAETERKQNIQEKIQLLQMGIQDPELNSRIQKMDLFSELWRDMGYGKAGSFLMTDEEYVTHRLTQMAIEQFVAEVGGQKALGMIMHHLQTGADMKEVMMGLMQNINPGIGGLIYGPGQGGVDPMQGAAEIPGGDPVMAAEPGVGQLQGIGG